MVRSSQQAPRLTPRQHIRRAIRLADELRDEIAILFTEHPGQALGLSVTDLDRLATKLRELERR